VITLDTSGVFALLNREDPDHKRTAAALKADPGPYVLPAGILGELGYLVDRRLGTDVLDALLADVEDGNFAVDPGEDDIPRIRELVQRYADLPLGFADAAVVACAERRGGRVLTLDLRDFAVIAREGRITPLPETKA
jgi:predicted nucleic acid-binding protein